MPLAVKYLELNLSMEILQRFPVIKCADSSHGKQFKFKNNKDKLFFLLFLSFLSLPLEEELNSFAPFPPEISRSCINIKSMENLAVTKRYR